MTFPFSSFHLVFRALHFSDGILSRSAAGGYVRKVTSGHERWERRMGVHSDDEDACFSVPCIALRLSFVDQVIFIKLYGILSSLLLP